MGEFLQKWNLAKVSTTDSFRWARVIMQQRKLRRTAISILGCLILLYLFSFFHRIQSSRSLFRAPPTRATHNRTLGFQKVYAIGLPGRTDKHDALVMATSCMDIDLEWQRVVKFDDLDRKAVPATFEPLFHDNERSEKNPGSVVGCWRAHLNVLLTMVRENIATALILEDDADWDVSLKDQLEQFAKGVRELQNDISPRGSPYGNSWDMFWLGACYSAPLRGVHDMYFIHNDSTVPPVVQRGGLWHSNHIFPEVLRDDTRIIHHSGSISMCLVGYAVTLAAARKILTALSLGGGRGNEIDLDLSDMCDNHPDLALSLQCFSIYPRLFGSHRFAGGRSRDSDIRLRPGGEHNEFSQDIVYSAITNVPRFLSEENDHSHALSQWPGDTIPTRRFDEPYAVFGERRQVDLRAFPAQTVPGINTPGDLDLTKLDRSLLIPQHDSK